MAMEINTLGSNTNLVKHPYTLRYLLWQVSQSVLPQSITEENWETLMQLLNGCASQKHFVPYNVWERGFTFSEFSMKNHLPKDDLNLSRLNIYLCYIESFFSQWFQKILSSNQNFLLASHMHRISNSLKLVASRLFEGIEVLTLHLKNQSGEKFQTSLSHEMLQCFERICCIMRLLCDIWVFHLPRTFFLWSPRRIIKTVVIELLDFILLPLLGVCDYLLVLKPEVHPNVMACINVLRDTLMFVQMNTWRCFGTFAMKMESPQANDWLLQNLEALKQNKTFHVAASEVNKHDRAQKHNYLSYILDTILCDTPYRSDTNDMGSMKILGALDILPHVVAASSIQFSYISSRLASAKTLSLAFLGLARIYKFLVTLPSHDIILRSSCFRSVKYVLRSLKIFHLNPFVDDLSQLFSDMLHTFFILCKTEIQVKTTPLVILTECWDIIQEILKLNLSYFDSQTQSFFECLSSKKTCSNIDEAKRSESLALAVDHFAQASDFPSLLQGLNEFFKAKKGRLYLNCLTSKTVIESFLSVCRDSTPVQIIHFSSLFTDVAESLSMLCSPQKPKRCIPFYHICVVLGCFLNAVQISTESLIVPFLNLTERLTLLIAKVQSLSPYSLGSNPSEHTSTGDYTKESNIPSFKYWKKMFSKSSIKAYIVLTNAQLSLQKQLENWMKPFELRMQLETTSLFYNSSVTEMLRKSLVNNTILHVKLFCQCLETFVEGQSTPQHNKSCCRFFLNSKREISQMLLESVIQVQYLYQLYPMLFDTAGDYWRRKSLEQICVLLNLFKRNQFMASLAQRILPYLLREIHPETQDFSKRVVGPSLIFSSSFYSPFLQWITPKSFNRLVKHVFCLLFNSFKQKISHVQKQSTILFLNNIRSFTLQLQDWLMECLNFCSFSSQSTLMQKLLEFIVYNVKIFAASNVKIMKRLQYIKQSYWNSFSLNVILMCLFFQIFSSVFFFSLDITFLFLRFIIANLNFWIKRFSASGTFNACSLEIRDIDQHILVMYCILRVCVNSILPEHSLTPKTLKYFKTLAKKLKVFCGVFLESRQEKYLQLFLHCIPMLSLLTRFLINRIMEFEKDSSDTLSQSFRAIIELLCFPYFSFSYSSLTPHRLSCGVTNHLNTCTSKYNINKQAKNVSLLWKVKNFNHISSNKWLPEFALSCSLICLSCLPKEVSHIDFDWDDAQEFCTSFTKNSTNFLCLSSALPNQTSQEGCAFMKFRDALVISFLVHIYKDHVCRNTSNTERKQYKPGLEISPYIVLFRHLYQKLRHCDVVVIKNLDVSAFFPLLLNHPHSYVACLVQLFNKWILEENYSEPTYLPEFSEFHSIISILVEQACQCVQENLDSIHGNPTNTTELFCFPNNFWDLQRLSLDPELSIFIQTWSDFLQSLAFAKNIFSFIRILHFKLFSQDISTLDERPTPFFDSKFMAFLVCILLISYNRTLLIRFLGFLHLKHKQNTCHLSLIHHPSSKLFNTFRYVIHASLLRLRDEMRHIILRRLNVTDQALHCQENTFLLLLYQFRMWTIHFSISVKIATNIHEAVKLFILQQASSDLWKFSFLLELLDLVSIGTSQFKELCFLIEEAVDFYQYRQKSIIQNCLYVEQQTKLFVDGLNLVDIFIHTICSALHRALILRKDVAPCSLRASKFLYRHLNKRAAQIRSTFAGLLYCLEKLPTPESALQLSRQLTRIWTSLYVSTDSMSTIMEREASHVLHIILNLNLMLNPANHVQRSMNFKSLMYGCFLRINKLPSGSAHANAFTLDSTYEEKEWKNVQSTLLNDGFYPLLDHLNDDLKQYLYVHLRPETQETFSALYKGFQRFYVSRISHKTCQE